MKVTGKNLLDIPDVEERTVDGVTYSVKNGVIKAKRAYTGQYGIYFTSLKLPVGTFIFNPGITKGTESLNNYLDFTNNTTIGFSLLNNNLNTPKKLTENDVKYNFSLVLHLTAGEMEWHPQMLLSDEPLPYSPYHEQLLTLPTPNGLPGIPVTSGGNYTDPQGQQWVCDEVDLERGVKVQRLGKVKIVTVDVSRDSKWYDATKSYSYEITKFTYPLSDNDAFVSAEFCNRFEMFKFGDFYNKGIETGGLLGHAYAVFNISKSLGICTTVNDFKTWFNENVVLYKILATPIETPLTDAEIAAYKALTAYGLDTVVQAGDGAGIKLDYQRDVNLVVKNLEDAIASMTTT